MKILEIEEHRWVGEGHLKTQSGDTMIYSAGKSPRTCGIGFYLSSDMEKASMEYKPVNERIVLVRIRGR